MKELKASELEVGKEVMLNPEVFGRYFEGYTILEGSHNPVGVVGKIYEGNAIGGFRVSWETQTTASYPAEDGVFLSPEHAAEPVSEDSKSSDFDNLVFGTPVVVTKGFDDLDAGELGVVIREHDSDREVRIAFANDTYCWINVYAFEKCLAIAQGKKSFPHKYATRIASDQSPDGLILIADSIEALESTFQDLHPGHRGLDPTKIKHAVVEGDWATQTLEVKFDQAQSVGATPSDEEGEICSPIEQPVPAPAASLFTDLGNLPLIPLHGK